MKVILLEDIKGVGKKSQVIDVSDGHAKNYLIPRKLAMEANKSNINELEQKNKSALQRQQRELEQAQALAQKLSNEKVVVKMKMGDNGKLFGSVTNKEIASALSSQTGMDVDKKKVVLAEPIKAAGEKQVEVKLHPKVTARVTVEIISER